MNKLITIQNYIHEEIKFRKCVVS